MILNQNILVRKKKKKKLDPKNIDHVVRQFRSQQLIQNVIDTDPELFLTLTIPKDKEYDDIRQQREKYFMKIVTENPKRLEEINFTYKTLEMCLTAYQLDRSVYSSLTEEAKDHIWQTFNAYTSKKY